MKRPRNPAFGAPAAIFINSPAVQTIRKGCSPIAGGGIEKFRLFNIHSDKNMLKETLDPLSTKLTLNMIMLRF